MQLLIGDVIVEQVRYRGRAHAIKGYEKGRVTIQAEDLSTPETVASSCVLHGPHWLSWFEDADKVSVYAS